MKIAHRTIIKKGDICEVFWRRNLIFYKHLTDESILIFFI